MIAKGLSFHEGRGEMHVDEAGHTWFAYGARSPSL
ncbi:hypothetical protein PAV_5c00680 [Paenibacillus alvei DSM 29]|nr:hypothetical protein PAV_5c00680 [Paenibacillus alvei DSM 29]